MTTGDIAILINMLGWAIGFALYAMLLVLAYRALRTGKAQRQRAAQDGYNYLPLTTALLGLLWNAGALATHGLHELGANSAAHTLPLHLLNATAFAALGFLPAVVVHSTLSALTASDSRAARALMFVAYALSSIAAVLHFHAALWQGEASSNFALQLLTCGFLLLMFCLLPLTRGDAGWGRAVWATALAVFAVSALHLSGGLLHADHDRWYAELIGHHASLPLALAVLYQDYRFAFADIFLKRALALLGFVALVTAALMFYVAAFPALPNAAGDGLLRINYDVRAIGLLLVLWVGTGLLYPLLREWTNRFVERVVLRRVDYAAWRAELARVVGTHESVAELFDDVCTRLAPALTASRVKWSEVASPANDPLRDALCIEVAHNDLIIPSLEDLVSISSRGATVLIPTSETPRYEIRVGELAGGRRFLSDDIAMFESLAVTIARRVDALRVTHERCEQVQREQEIAKLATEAQLRLLRAQINPHFLFNALTTIGYLIQTSPPRAFDTLLRLTDLLRRVLRASEEWTTLGEELKLAESYLDIERARFEERLRVRFDVPVELHTLLVPSLIIQPLVENAIKHGIAPLRSGGEVSITARLNSANAAAPTLVITVRDTGAGASLEQLAAGRLTGVGLANVEQRMRLCCNDAGSFSIETRPQGGASVELRVPLRSKVAAQRGIETAASVEEDAEVVSV
jgi:two-component system LytT family sensor kinase